MDVYVVTFCNQYVDVTVSMREAKLIAESRETCSLEWDDLADGCALADGYFIWFQQLTVDADDSANSGAEKA